MPIVETVGHKRQGVDELLAAAVATARAGTRAVAAQRPPVYGSEIEPHVEELSRRVAAACKGVNARWAAVRLLEGDDVTSQRLERVCPAEAEALAAEGKRLRKSHDNPDIRRIYREYLGEPLGERSHRLLHTTYSSRDVLR